MDIYTKVVLTVIAVALSAIALQGTVGPATAAMDGCGSFVDPCYVKTGLEPLTVRN